MANPRSRTAHIHSSAARDPPHARRRPRHATLRVAVDALDIVEPPRGLERRCRWPSAGAGASSEATASSAASHLWI
jgi:hypothetical protein